MPPTCCPTKVCQLAGAAIASIALLVAGSGTAMAAYGPPAPGPPPVPGGFSEVVTSQTIGPGADDIRHLDFDGMTGSLDIRKDTFLQPVQLTITEPFVKDDNPVTTSFVSHRKTCGPGIGLGDAGFPGYCAIAGAGILVQINGVADTHKFRKPMILHIDWRPKLRTIVVAWNGRRFVKAKHDIDRPHSVRIQIRRDVDIAILQWDPQRDRDLPGTLAAARQQQLAIGFMQALSASAMFLRP